MPKSKKSKRRKSTRTSSCETATTVSKTSDNNAFEYGGLLLELLLDTVDASDLIALRCVNRRARRFIDSRIFKHVTLQTDTDCTSRVVPVITATGQRLPAPALTPYSPAENVRLVILYYLQFTAVLDLEYIHPKVLGQLEYGLPKLCRLHTLRLKSDSDGKHTYHMWESFGAPTVVVFPSFYPFLGKRQLPVPLVEQPTMIPNVATKLVQHIAFAVDWRGAVLFRYDRGDPSHVKDEVWIMDHAWIEPDYGHFDIWDDEIIDTEEDLTAELRWEIVARLHAGINLTIVGWETVRFWGPKFFDIADDEFFNAPDDHERTIKAIRDKLPVRNKRALNRLHFSTWDEYAATLSPEELENEKLPPGYLERWRALQAERYKEPPNPSQTLPLEPEPKLDDSVRAMLKRYG